LTLVLAETALISTTFDPSRGWIHRKRPGLDYFLATLSAQYEIVIYSAALYADAGPLVDRIDPTRQAPHRLFGETLRRAPDGRRVKPIDALGRDMAKVVVVEDVADLVDGASADNTILLKPWSGALASDSKEDLLDIIPLLQLFAAKQVPDVRPILRQYHTAGSYIPSLYRQQRVDFQTRQDRQIAAALANVNFAGNVDPAADKGAGGSGSGEANAEEPPPRSVLSVLSGGWLG